MFRSFGQSATKRTSTTRVRPSRGARARLNLEVLEERLQLSTASLSGSTLIINEDAGHTLLLEGAAGSKNLVNVYDNTTLLKQLSTTAFKQINVTLGGNNVVNINSTSTVGYTGFDRVIK